MKKNKNKSKLVCPECNHSSMEIMPVDACHYFWQCPHCDELIKPENGDCCVFCSYGDTQCPPVQQSENCC